MRKIGFSTGALALGNFRLALELLKPLKLACVELSALRVSEVNELVNALPDLELDSYSYISFHAPSSYLHEEEEWLGKLLYESIPPTWPIVLHPDAIFDFNIWRPFGRRVAIENMDRRKIRGRDVSELWEVFRSLPSAMLCLDLGHARQCDSSMTEAYLMLKTFSERLAQVHLSEVSTESRHNPISYTAKLAFQQIASFVPEDIPVILESQVNSASMKAELLMALDSLQVRVVSEHTYT